jgi:hypothetical protein
MRLQLQSNKFTRGFFTRMTKKAALKTAISQNIFIQNFWWLLKNLELCAQKIFEGFLVYSKLQLAHSNFALFAIFFSPKFDEIDPW